MFIQLENQGIEDHYTDPSFRKSQDGCILPSGPKKELVHQDCPCFPRERESLKSWRTQNLLLKKSYTCLILDKTRPSILCVTHQVVKREMIQLAELCLTRWWIISGTWWYWVSIWRYWLVLGQYMLVLLGIRWYRVSKGLVCLYIL